MFGVVVSTWYNFIAQCFEIVCIMFMFILMLREAIDCWYGQRACSFFNCNAVVLRIFVTFIILNSVTNYYGRATMNCRVRMITIRYFVSGYVQMVSSCEGSLILEWYRCYDSLLMSWIRENIGVASLHSKLLFYVSTMLVSWWQSLANCALYSFAP